MSEILSGLHPIFHAILVNSLAALLLLAIVAGIGVLVYAQFRKDNFDLRALVTDPKTGQPSIHQLGQFTALVVSSWGLIVLVLHDKLTETYFTTYMAVWAGANTLDRFLRTREGGDERQDRGSNGGDGSQDSH